VGAPPQEPQGERPEAERRLHQAQKMEALGRLAGGIAHDVNNYLAAIRTQCELVLSRARGGRLEGADVERKMELVVGTVLKASSLVERLLAFGRRQESHPGVVDLNDVVEAFERVMRGTLGSGVELDVRLDPELPPVEVDLAQIEQVLANLFVNARDAVAGRGRLSIETAKVAPPGAAPGEPWAALTVADTGPGVPPELREQIFEPFFTTKAGVGASGLGLATVYALVEEARGRVEVESLPERPRGAAFRVLLPPAGRAPARKRRARGAEGAPAGGGERILLVDDHDELRAAVADLLGSLGYRVAAAAGCEEALAAQRREGAPGFDLVVTDVRLSDGSGPDLVARLREGAAGLKALYMSGYTDRISLRSGSRTGEAYFVKKPFSGEGLARMVRELLDAR
jgi:nitrogen-specific signal transduction histidine kinase